MGYAGHRSAAKGLPPGDWQAAGRMLAGMAELTISIPDDLEGWATTRVAQGPYA